MRKQTQATLESLQMAIHGVTAPFVCEGSVITKEPVTIVFRDKSRFDVVRAADAFEQKENVRPLLEQCKPAPFGDGKKTRYDRSVRDALQLKAENKGFNVENFDPQSDGILKQIQRELLPHDPNPISAELYTVNVYTRGGHFKSHKDTPRGEDMFGSLVVCLPSQFSRGSLVLTHRGIVKKFNWGTAISQQKEPNLLHWAAFFGDVNHEIESISTGVRVTLTYLLRRGDNNLLSDNSGADDQTPRVHEAWLALLADKSFLPKGGTLAYPCCHLYHQDARFQQVQLAISRQSATMLKGRDQLVAATALQAGLEVNFNPYMFENCVDETWQLERFPTPVEKKKLRRQMDSDQLQKALPIRGDSVKDGDFDVTWIEEPPNSARASRKSEEDGDSELPVASLLHSCDYCPWGYFGNESSQVDLYTYAALHIEIPPFDSGIRAAGKLGTSTSVERKGSTRERKPRQE